MEDQKLEAMRHSLAHLLAAAVLELYPDAKHTIGPAIDNGFYYDFDLPQSISDKDLAKIEAKMREIAKTWTGFKCEEKTVEEARACFRENHYKLELIDEIISTGEPITFYTSGNFVDLCCGGHVKSMQDIPPDAWRLSHIAGAYWRGDEKNKMLTRIYGLAFTNKTELDQYLERKEEAEKRDHKKLGRELDLFVFSELVGPGLPLWTPKGTIVRDILDSFVWELRAKYGYERVDIPHLAKKELYATSGHWEKFKNELFQVKTREGHLFALKPMNCPHHAQIFARKQWSYRELPQRYASTTKVYRDEQTGELAGLARVRAITQDDAHVFCREGQLKEEFLKIWDIVHGFYGAFGFKPRVRISLRDPHQPKAYLGKPEQWEIMERVLKEIVREKGTQAVEKIGEAAFYGPKLDFITDDSLGREWQLATIQIDVNMPERLDLFCINEKGEKESVVMIHAAIMGAIERFMAILIEQYAGAFPLWLTPVQVAVLTIGEKHQKFAEKVNTELKSVGIRTELDSSDNVLSKKIKEQKLAKVPYLVIIGDKETASGQLTIESRRGKLENITPNKFREMLLEEIVNKA